MSEYKTLVYDAMKLWGPDALKFSIKENELPDFPVPNVSVPREKLKQFSDSYKILHEIVSEVLGMEKFTILDIMRWHLKQKAHKERRRTK